MCSVREVRTVAVGEDEFHKIVPFCSRYNHTTGSRESGGGNRGGFSHKKKSCLHLGAEVRRNICILLKGHRACDRDTGKGHIAATCHIVLFKKIPAF